MHETIIDWRGVAAGLTLADLVDDSYLEAPAEEVPQAPGRPPGGPCAAAGEAEAPQLLRAQPALRHLLD